MGSDAVVIDVMELSETSDIAGLTTHADGVITPIPTSSVNPTSQFSQLDTQPFHDDQLHVASAAAGVPEDAEHVAARARVGTRTGAADSSVGNLHGSQIVGTSIDHGEFHTVSAQRSTCKCPRLRLLCLPFGPLRKRQALKF